MIFFKAQAGIYDLLMSILSHSAIPIYSLPGLQHQTIARKSNGTQASEAWKQTLAPGAATPPHFHECEEVICILQGKGEVAIEDKREPFAADCTLILSPRVVHQITNTGSENMKLVAWLSESPGRVFLPSGDQLALPWDGQNG
jgi:mannose-6-phosphate isomerase-like protein (cupin superfamily)